MDRAEAHECLELARRAVAGTADTLEAVEQEHAQLVEAAKWLVRKGEPGNGLELAGRLWNFWYSRGRVVEGEGILDRLLADLPDRQPSPGLAVALYGRGELAFRQGHNPEARGFFQRAQTTAREVGDWHSENRSLCGLARTALRDHDYDGVDRLAGEGGCVAREHGDRDLEWLPQHMQAAAARMRGETAQARSLYQRSIDLATELGNTKRVTAEYHNLGYVELHAGELAAARRYFQRAIELARRDDDQLMLAYGLLDATVVAIEEANLPEAAILLGATRAAFEARHTIPDPDDQVELDRAIERVRAGLDPARIDQAARDGAALGGDEAINRGLAVLGGLTAATA